MIFEKMTVYDPLIILCSKCTVETQNTNLLLKDNEEVFYTIPYSKITLCKLLPLLLPTLILRFSDKESKTTLTIRANRGIKKTKELYYDILEYKKHCY